MGVLKNERKQKTNEEKREEEVRYDDNTERTVRVRERDGRRVVGWTKLVGRGTRVQKKAHACPSTHHQPRTFHEAAEPFFRFPPKIFVTLLFSFLCFAFFAFFDSIEVAVSTAWISTRSSSSSVSGRTSRGVSSAFP